MTQSATFLLVNSSVAFLLWGAAFIFFRARVANASGNRDVIGASQFVFFFALAVTFSTRGVYLALDQLAGINNLAWLVSYLCLTTALYIAVIVAYSMDGRNAPVWSKPLYMLTSSTLIVLFASGIANSPSYVEHALARSPHELLFMVVLFAYAIRTGWVPARLFQQFASRESSLYLRLRTSLVALAAGAGVACMGWKLAYTIIGYFWPATWLLAPLWLLVWFFFVLSSVCLVIACLPEAFFRWVASGVEWGRNVWVLYDLQVLRAQLERFCPPVVPDSAGWWARITDPSYHLYRTVIYLFDCQRLLVRHIAHPEARLLYEALQTLPLHSDSFDDNLAHSRQINREVKQRMKRREPNQLAHEVARWLSRIIHPFTLVIPTLIAVAWFADVPFWRAVGWTLLALPVAILPTSLYIAFHVRGGRLRDWDVSIREQRHTVYAVALGSIVLLLVLFIWFEAPQVLQACLIAAIAAYALGAIINQVWTKISIHATAAAGSAAVLFYFAPLVGAVMAVAALGAGWARIYLGRHTLSQVVTGWLVALLCVFLVFPFFLQVDPWFRW